MKRFEFIVGEHLEQQVIIFLTGKNKPGHSLHRQFTFRLVFVFEIISIATHIEELPHLIGILNCFHEEIIEHLIHIHCLCIYISETLNYLLDILHCHFRFSVLIIEFEESFCIDELSVGAFVHFEPFPNDALKFRG